MSVLQVVCNLLTNAVSGLPLDWRKQPPQKRWRTTANGFAKNTVTRTALHLVLCYCLNRVLSNSKAATDQSL